MNHKMTNEQIYQAIIQAVSRNDWSEAKRLGELYLSNTLEA